MTPTPYTAEQAQQDLLDILFGSTEEPTPEPRPAPKPAAPVQPRHFWRCPDCLSVTATDGPAPRELHCGLCNVPVDYMGEVKRFNPARLGKIEWYCPCDGRCINALGPNCDCQCGAANHGKGLLCRVVDAGETPTVTPPDSIAAERRAKEYRQACSDAKQRIDWAFAIIAKKRAGGWIENYSDLNRATYVVRDYRAAAAKLNHSARMKALAQIGRQS